MDDSQRVVADANTGAGLPPNVETAGIDVVQVGESRKDHFTIVPNDRLRNPGLTWAEKGMVDYLTSHRAGYGLTIEQIIGDSEDGERAVRTILGSLERKGWIARTRQRDVRGRLGRYRFTIHPDGPACGSQSGPDLEIQPKPAGRNQTAFSRLDAPGWAAQDIEEQRKKTSTATAFVEDQKKIISLGRGSEVTTREAPNDERETISISSSKDLEPADIIDAEIVPDADPITAACLPAMRTAEPDITEEEATAIVGDVRYAGKIQSVTGWARSAAGQADIRERLYKLRTARQSWDDLAAELGNTAPADPCTDCTNGWQGRDPVTQAPIPCHRCRPNLIPASGCTRVHCTHCHLSKTAGAWDV